MLCEVLILHLSQQDVANSEAALDTVFQLFESEAIDDDTLQSAIDGLERIADAAPEALVRHTSTLEQMILDRNADTGRIEPLGEDDVTNACIHALIWSVDAEDSRAAETVHSLEHESWGFCRRIAEAAATEQWKPWRAEVFEVFEGLVRLDPSLVASNIDLLEDAVHEDARSEVQLAFARLIAHTVPQTNQADDRLATNTIDVLVDNIRPDEDPDVLFYTLHAIDQILSSKARDINDQTAETLVEQLCLVVDAHHGSDLSTRDSRIIENVFSVAATLASVYPDDLLDTLDLHLWTQNQTYRRSATHVIANLAAERPRRMGNFVQYLPRMLQEAIDQASEDESIQSPYSTKALANLAQVSDFHDRIKDLDEQFELLLTRGDEQTQLYAIIALRRLAESEEYELAVTAVDKIQILSEEGQGEVQIRAHETLVSIGFIEAPPQADSESGEESVSSAPSQRSRADRLWDLAFSLLQNLEYNMDERSYWQTVDTLRVELEQREERLRARMGDDHVEDTMNQLSALHRRLDRYSTQNITESSHPEVFADAPVIAAQVRMYAIHRD